MLVKEKLGNLTAFDTGGYSIDRLRLEWYETNKRVLHKHTDSRCEVVMRFLKENQELQQDDILFKDDSRIIAVEINSCDAIVIKPTSSLQLASLCYEIGNKHLPLFHHEDVLLLPFEEPIFRWLAASGYNVQRETRKLLHQLKTSVAAHGSSGSLFSKILQLTNTSNG
jgi:urease accessory protein